MLKKIFLLLVLLLPLSVFAFEEVEYKNIKDNSRLTITDNIWSDKVKKKTKTCFIKKTASGTTNFSEFYSPDGTFLFSTGTNYEFINKGDLIGYSNFDLKFYQFEMRDGILEQRELVYDEVQELFPKFKIIKISQFSPNTNSLKIKKGRGNLNVIVLNDTDRSFYNYDFTTNNSKIERYALKGFLKISKKGMIQFSKFGDNSKNYPWFILLIR